MEEYQDLCHEWKEKYEQLNEIIKNTLQEIN